MLTGREKYVIEARLSNGHLTFVDPQPESVFGLAAINGIDADTMAKIIFRHKPDAVLTGDKIPWWPSVLDPRWIAREKTW